MGEQISRERQHYDTEKSLPEHHLGCGFFSCNVDLDPCLKLVPEKEYLQGICLKKIEAMVIHGLTKAMSKTSRTQPKPNQRTGTM